MGSTVVMNQFSQECEEDDSFVAESHGETMLNSGLGPKKISLESIDAQNRKSKLSYASFFKDNRVPNDKTMLKFIPHDGSDFVLKFDEIDTVEEAMGFCLIGCVMGRKPSAFAIMDLTKRWGKNVKFRMHETGWITFTFANMEDRDRILKSGPYLVQGNHLFLKILPRCFLYRVEDMNIMPSWVQIHGLPADCWSFQALSRVASLIGTPIHTDQLTQSKQRTNYARILIEVDATKPRLKEQVVRLPTGQVTNLQFVFEFEPKFCNSCRNLGHISENCGLKESVDGEQSRNVVHETHETRVRSISVQRWKRFRQRGRSRAPKRRNNIPSRSLSVVKDKGEKKVGEKEQETKQREEINENGPNKHMEMSTSKPTEEETEIAHNDHKEKAMHTIPDVQKLKSGDGKETVKKVKFIPGPCYPNKEITPCTSGSSSSATEFPKKKGKGAATHNCLRFK